MKSAFYNLLILVALIIAYYLFLEHYAGPIADNYRWGGELNLLVLPFIIGFIACHLFRGPVIARPLLVSLIPIIALIPKLSEGGDPAKPGLENLIYLVFIASFCVGAFAEIGVFRVYKRLTEKV